MPGLREDVALCMASECSTTYPCDGRLLADFIDEIVPDLRKIAEGDLSGEEAAAVAKEILSQIRL